MGASAGTIEVRGLTKRFGRIAAVSDLSFTVEPGRVTGFLGPNGAGKTTTLRILLDLVLPTAGTATIGGRRYRDLDQPARMVGAVLEATNFHPARRARDHLRMLCMASGISRARIDEVLTLVGLTADAERRVGGYSLGMRQRLQLASALLGDPGVLVLDEPSNGLDPQGIAWLRELMRHLAGEGRTVLVSSHLLAEMAQTVDDVVIVSQGRLREQGPLSELTARSRSSMRVRTPEPDRLAAVAAHFGFSPRPSGPGTVLVEGATPERLGPILAANQVVCYELVQVTQDLESVFLELTTSLAHVPGAPPPPGADGGGQGATGTPWAPPGGQAGAGAAPGAVAPDAVAPEVPPVPAAAADDPGTGSPPVPAAPDGAPPVQAAAPTGREEAR